MTGAIPLIPLYPCMPVCVNSCWDILKPLKTAVYVQQLLVFRKKIVYILCKNNVAWLGQIADCFSLWGVGFSSRAVCFESCGGWSGKRIIFFSKHFCFILLIGILSLSLPYHTCNLRDNQLPHYTLHFKRYCANFFPVIQKSEEEIGERMIWQNI